MGRLFIVLASLLALGASVAVAIYIAHAIFFAGDQVARLDDANGPWAFPVFIALFVKLEKFPVAVVAAVLIGAALLYAAGGLMIRRSHSNTAIELQVAEVAYPSGAIRMRYTRYLTRHRTAWIRHGQFRSYHEDGTLASEGNFEHDKEDGPWRRYHANGQLAAEGAYVLGSKVGIWKCWTATGEPESRSSD